MIFQFLSVVFHKRGDCNTRRVSSLPAIAWEKTDMVEVLQKEAGKMGHSLKKGADVPLDG